jgi:hypothetical protein
MKGFAALLPMVLLLASTGCSKGSPQERTVPAELEYAADTLDAIREFQAVARKSLPAAKAEIGPLVENYEAYEQEPLGDHKATYDSIVQGLRDLETMLQGNAGSREVLAKIDELLKLAQQLPTS